MMRKNQIFACCNLVSVQKLLTGLSMCRFTFYVSVAAVIDQDGSPWSDPDTTSGYIVSHQDFDGNTHYPENLHRFLDISFKSSTITLTFISVGIHYYSELRGFWPWRRWRAYICDDYLSVSGLRDRSRKLCGYNQFPMIDGYVATIYPDPGLKTSFTFVTQRRIVEGQWPWSDDEVISSESFGFLIKYEGES